MSTDESENKVNQDNVNQEHKLVFRAPPSEHKLVFTAPPKEGEFLPKENLVPIKEIPKESTEKIILPKHSLSPDLEQQHFSIATPKTLPQSSPAVAKPITPEPKPIPPIRPQTVAPSPEKAPSMRSFAYDIKHAVTEKGITLSNIVMAESRKREELHVTEEDIEEMNKNHNTIKVILISLGSLAILAGLAALFITYNETRPVGEELAIDPVSPFVRIENGTTLIIPDGYKSTLIQSVGELKKKNIQIGTLYGIAIKEEGDGINKRTDASRFLRILEANLPGALSRTLEDKFSFGFYSASNLNTYLILKTDSFDNAFAGMLEWEDTIANDIGPLFFDHNQLLIATTTQSLGKNTFVDKVYENKDARVLMDKEGKPIMLWSIIDQTMIIIASNPMTLEELSRRMTTQSIVR